MDIDVAELHKGPHGTGGGC